MAFELRRGNLFVVRYAAPQELAPARNAELVAELRRLGTQSEVGVVFVLAEGIRIVELSVPAFWLDVTGDRSLRLAAMAIVSGSRAVKVAAKGFAVANSLRRVPLRVETFVNEADALAWVELAVAAAPGEEPLC